MVRPTAHQDQRVVALLKNSDGSIAALPAGTLELRADAASPGPMDTSELAGYRNTAFLSYRTALGAKHPDFFAHHHEGKRVVWLPASGFLGQTWYDGPLLVIEKDGLVSSYIPTGASAVLLLAPDEGVSSKKNAIGKPKEQAWAIEGSPALALLRGAVAATFAATESLRDRLHAALPAAAVTDPPPRILIQLALLRMAAGEGRGVTICAPSDSKPSPQLRRLCENTGISWSSWDEPDASLEQLFFWYDQSWDKQLLTTINANGPVIPGR